MRAFIFTFLVPFEVKQAISSLQTAPLPIMQTTDSNKMKKSTVSSAAAPAPTNSASIGKEEEPTASLKMILAVPYADLVTATGGFSKQNVIGRGGYGTVYCGSWKLTDVAVKRIMPMKGIASVPVPELWSQSLAELWTLAMFRHDNILPLYAYCRN